MSTDYPAATTYADYRTYGGSGRHALSDTPQRSPLIDVMEYLRGRYVIDGERLHPAYVGRHRVDVDTPMAYVVTSLGWRS